MAEKVQRLALYETKAVVPLDTYPVGVTLQPLHVEGNSLLSSVFYKSGSGTVLVEYYDTTTGEGFGEEYELGAHAPVSAFGTNRVLFTRLHNKPVARITVTGGSVEFGVYITVVASFASELDSALIFDGQTADLLRDKGLVAGTYDDITGEFKLLRSTNGRLLVDATFSSVTTETVEHVTLTNANTEYSYTFPANTIAYLIKTQSGHDFKYAPRVGESGTKYLTLPVYEKNGIEPITSRTVYFQSKRAGEIMEISSWV